MHLFRWLRFLSVKKRPRRSSRGFFRSFSRQYRYDGRSMTGSMPSPMAVPASFDLRPSLIHVGSPPSRLSGSASSSSMNGRRSSSSRRQRATAVGDREFLEEYHRDHGAPEDQLSPRATAAAFTRVSSMFKPVRRSTIMERATMFNLFNDLQFDLEAAERAEGSMAASEPDPEPQIQRKKSRIKMKKKKSKSADLSTSTQPLVAAGGDGSSMFRQYWANMRAAASEKSKRPLSAMQTHDYLQGSIDYLHPVWSHNIPTNGSRSSNLSNRSKKDEDSKPEPIQFLFFGGNSEENPQHMREMDRVQRYCRARFAAEQPMPSCTKSIFIKPTLVRNLPPVFEPSFIT